MSLLSLTATVTAAKAVAATEAEAAHTTHTTARGHQARRHDSTTARGHEDNDLVSQGIAVAPCPPPLHQPSPRSLASLRVRRRFVSPRIVSRRIASQRFGFFSTQRFGERQCDGVAVAAAVAVAAYSGNSFSPACAVRVPSVLLTLTALSTSAAAEAALCGALGHS